jgi:long-chain acyl-CoA synthetase
MAITPDIIQATKAKITCKDQFFEVVQDGEFKAYKHAASNVIELLDAARGHGELDFIVSGDQRLSYNTFFSQTDKLASALQTELGIQSGDRVAIAMQNCPEWCIAYTAATLIGAVVVPINSWGKADELDFALTDCDARVLIADQKRYALIRNRISDYMLSVIVTEHEEKPQDKNVFSFHHFLTKGSGSCVKPAINAKDICAILYTSGSTGFPKGVIHNHTAICQSLMNMMYLGYLLMELEGSREMKGGADREAPMLTVPLFHATGLLGSFYLPAITGQKIIMMPKWNSDKALQLIETEKVTTLSTVPAILKDLLNHPAFDQYETSSLIRVVSAGAATPAGLAESIEAKLGKVSRSAGYGMTETMAVAAAMSGAIFDLKPYSAGIQSPIMDIRIRDANNRTLARGEEGEIELHGVVVTSGYWKNPEATAKTFTEDGWLKTGDIGLIDADEFLYITGRSKELVIRGGENIYPGEVENAAYRHEQVQEVVVFGVPDDTLGEALAMIFYTKADSELTSDELRTFLTESISSFKVPKYIVLSPDPLPRNASEKLNRLKAKEMFESKFYAA